MRLLYKMGSQLSRVAFAFAVVILVAVVLLTWKAGRWPGWTGATPTRPAEELSTTRTRSKPGTYEKLPGCADTAGQSYEQKLSTLLFVRGIKSGRDFSLMGNMKAAGKYDDVVFVDHGRENSTHSIQLKHKLHNFALEFPENRGKREDRKTKGEKYLSEQILASADGDFSLLMYLDSYRKIKREFENVNSDLKMCGDFENIRFLLFTNAFIKESLYESNKTKEIVGDLFGTGGRYFYLKDSGSISKKLKMLDDVISNLIVSLAKLSRDIETKPEDYGKETVAQRVEKAMASSRGCQHNKQIKEIVEQLVGNPCKAGIDQALKSDIFQLERSSESRNEFLKRFLLCTNQPHERQLDDIIKREIRSFWTVDTREVSCVYSSVLEGVKSWSENENIILTAASRIWTKALHRSRRETLGSYGVEFNEDAIKSIVSNVMDTQDAGVRLLAVDQPALIAMALLQQSEDFLEVNMQRPTLVSSELLVRQQESVVSAWRSIWCNTLVVECEKDLDMEQARPLVNALIQITADSQDETKAENLAGREEPVHSRNKKIIVLMSRKEHNMVEAVKQMTNNFVEIEYKINWKDLTPASQNHLRKKSICFQGIRKSLGELLGDREALTSKLDGSAVWQLLTGTAELGKRLDPQISLNISRSLTIEDSEPKPVRNLADLPGHVVAITGKPGMGKSTLFTELAHSTKTNDWLLWVIRINLLDCSKYLHKVKSENILIDAIAFLHSYSANGEKLTSFEKVLFAESLDKKTPKIAVMLDGVDEISPHYETEVMAIIEKLTKEPLYKLCVTCRSVMKEKIESALRLKASDLTPFTRSDQIAYLEMYWQDKDKNIDKDNDYDKDKDSNCLKAFAVKLLKLADETFSETFLTGIPLMIEMMAEIYYKDVVEYCKDETKLITKLNLSSLYDTFVERKHEIFFEEKKREDKYISTNITKQKDDFEVFVKKHVHAAVKSFLEQNEYQLITGADRNEIEKGFSKFYDDVRSGVEKTGIVDGLTPTGQLQFIHRTFIEFFLAKWIYNNNDENITFVQAVLFQPRFKMVTEMLNQMYVDANKHPLHISVLNRDIKTVKHFLKSTPDLVDSLDYGGRTALHLVAFVRDPIHNLALVNIAQLLLDNKASVETIDGVFQWKPLQIADKAQAWALVNLILKHEGNATGMLTTRAIISNENNFQEFIELFQHPHTNTGKLMVIATRYGMTSLLEYLVEQGGECRSLGDGEVSLMHLAAERGHVNVMTYLRDKGVLYTVPDRHGNVPMHFAVKGGNTGVLVFLMKQDESKPSLNARNVEMETPPTLAKELFTKELDIVKNLDSLTSDTHDLDQSSLDLSQRSCDVMEYLLKQEGAISEDDHMELERGIEEYKTKLARLRAAMLNRDLTTENSYRMTKGTATLSGQMYEIKIAALLFLRLKNSGMISEFTLATNVDGAGALDDIVVKYTTKENPRQWKACFIQIKHKTRAVLKRQVFLPPRGDFSVKKFFHSFLNIKKHIATVPLDDYFKGCNIESCRFILYTNAKYENLSKERKADGCSEIDELLKSNAESDLKLNFSEEYDRDIFDFLVEDGSSHSNVAEFLKAFTVFTGQPPIKDMEKLIKTELKIAIDMNKTDICLLYFVYINAFQEWSDGSNIVLTSESDLWKKIYNAHKITMATSQEVNRFCLDLQFQNIHTLGEALLDAGPLLHIVPGRSFTKVCCTKLVQTLDCEVDSYLFLNLNYLLEVTEAVTSAWSSESIRWLVIVSDSSDAQADLCTTLYAHLERHNKLHLEKQIIVISKEGDAFTLELKQGLIGRCRTIQDRFQLEQLDPQCAKMVEKRTTLLQNQPINLTSHIGDEADCPSSLFVDDFLQTPLDLVKSTSSIAQ